MVCLLNHWFFLLATETQSENKVEVKDSTATALNKDSGYVKGITTARAISLAEGLLGLMSIVIGWRATAGSILALLFGLVGIILGGLTLRLRNANL